MITAIVTVRAQPGKGDELAENFRAYAEQVKSSEPGTLLYSLNRSREDPDVFVAVEMYRDEAAMQAHMENFKKSSAPPPPFAGPPEFMLLDRVA